MLSLLGYCLNPFVNYLYFENGNKFLLAEGRKGLKEDNNVNFVTSDLPNTSEYNGYVFIAKSFLG